MTQIVDLARKDDSELTIYYQMFMLFCKISMDPVDK